MDESFMKERAILPLIASMALPAVVSMIVNSLYNIVDSLFVAMISEQAMTAVSLVFPMQNFVNAVCIGFGVGLNAIISICLGAGQKGTADVAATHGVFLAVIHGLVMTAGCIWAVPSFLRAFTQDAGLIDLGLRYAVIVFAFSTILSVDLVYEKMFQAVGRMQVTMAGLSLGCLVNIIGDPILIFGLGPIPAMGIEGAAWATGLGQTVNLLFYAVVCHWRPLRVEVCRRHLHWDIELDKRLYGIGIPAALNMGLSSVFLVALNHLLAPFSPTYIFILGVYYKLQTFLSMPTNGIIQGVRPLIGYNYGAGELGRVRRIYRTRWSSTAWSWRQVWSSAWPYRTSSWAGSRPVRKPLQPVRRPWASLPGDSYRRLCLLRRLAPWKGWGRAIRPLPSPCCATSSSACRRRGSSAAFMGQTACGTPSGSLNVWQHWQPGRFTTTMPQPLRQKRRRHEV